MIGIYWISHHRHFGYIKRYNTRLMLLNLMFLFFIACMPFVANLLGRYTDVPLAIIVYTLTVAALGLSLALIWFYARHKGFLAPDITTEEMQRINIRLVVAPVTFVLAAPFAFISSVASITVWWLSPIAVVLITHLLVRERRK